MKIKIDIDQVTIGMYIAELDRPWLESPFLFQGFVVEDEAELEKLRESCNFVFVDDIKSESSPELKRLVALAEKTSDGQRARLKVEYQLQSTAESFKKEIDRASEIHAHSTTTAIKILDDFRLGHSVNSEDAKSVVSDLVSIISSNANTALWLTNLRDKNQQLANHCLNVSILSIAFGRYLGYPLEMLSAIGLGGLLHDAGLARVSQDIIDKYDELSEIERENIRRHPLQAEAVFLDQGDLPVEVLDIVRDHHERIDAKGFPEGKGKNAVHEHVRIVAIADVYDTMTSTRAASDKAYPVGLTPQEALTAMHKRATQDFGNKLVEEFIKCIGIYPIGSLVILNSGALGIVMSSNPDQRMTPLVLLVRNEDGKDVMPRELVNLATKDKSKDDSWNISRMVDSGSYGIDVSAIAEEEMLFH